MKNWEGDGMKSLRDLYKIGRGPSSSHTMGPQKAARLFAQAFPEAERHVVTLYGSLAKTGEGHGTDAVLRETLAPKEVALRFDRESETPHPNTMDFSAWSGEEELGAWRVFSVGGGDIRIEEQPAYEAEEVYKLEQFTQIAEYCREKELRLWQFVEQQEGEGIWDYLEEVWNTMKAAIRAGLAVEGNLPGGLGIQRKARYLYRQRHIDETPQTRENRLVCSYAFAVSEQNACCGEIVTAPTCGACAVMPSVLKYMQETRGCSDREILQALATGGLMGNLIKTNASISGAECGCQAEIGSACAMAAAALAELHGMEIDQIEYAAEVALEHHLGLTCDPIGGLVQIPCIERNAVAAMRAINALNIANFLTYTRKISFDQVVKTMYGTGRDLARPYRETSEGGLAKLMDLEKPHC